MKVVLSCTSNSLYDFFLPIVVDSWRRIGVEAIVFITEKRDERFNLAMSYCPDTTQWHELNIAEEREPTYFQCVRLFAACLDLDGDEILITSDIDMCVFSDFLKIRSGESIMIFGADLTPESQYPMCYASMTVDQWRRCMNIDGKAYQTKLSEALDGIVCENMRGNHWSKDQEMLKNGIDNSGIRLFKMNRAFPNTQFATRRADRTGWVVGKDLVDAHLPRPGYADNSYKMIKDLMAGQYPTADFTWMDEYRNKYISLL